MRCEPLQVTWVEFQLSSVAWTSQFIGGSMGSVVGEKIARGIDLALKKGCPLFASVNPAVHA